MLKKTVLLTLTTACLLASCNPQNEQTAENEQATENEGLEEGVNTEEMSELEKEHTLYLPGYADSVNLGSIALDTLKASARREATASIGGTDININYGSPGKRGRVLWNGLVSYDQIWVSGSHWATAVTFSQDVKVEDTNVPAGTYAFFTIPGREEWILLLNKNYDQHLADDYQQSEDVVRISVTPEVSEEVVQRLTYAVEELGENKGAIVLSWDQIQVSMPFEVL